MSNAPELGQRRKINWLNVKTVLSAAILIGAEVFGAALPAAGRSRCCSASAIYGIIILRAVFFTCRPRGDGLVHPAAQRVEPFTSRHDVASERRAPLRERRAHLTLKKFSPRVRFFLIVTARIALFAPCPISHVPVAACRSVGIRTRGRTAA